MLWSIIERAPKKKKRIRKEKKKNSPRRHYPQSRDTLHQPFSMVCSVSQRPQAWPSSLARACPSSQLPWPYLPLLLPAIDSNEHRSPWPRWCKDFAPRSCRSNSWLLHYILCPARKGGDTISFEGAAFFFFFPPSFFCLCRARTERGGERERERADHSRKGVGEAAFAYTGRPRVILSLLPEAPPRL